MGQNLFSQFRYHIPNGNMLPHKPFLLQDNSNTFIEVSFQFLPVRKVMQCNIFDLSLKKNSWKELSV